MKHKALLGILLGYGYNNSWLFKWKIEGSANVDRKNMYKEENNRHYLIAGKPLTIPPFAQLDQNESEEIVSHYEKDRKRIYKLYKGTSFLDTTLKKLQE